MAPNGDAGRQHKLFWQLWLSYLLITLVCLAAVVLVASVAFRHFNREQTAAALEAEALLLSRQIVQHSSGSALLSDHAAAADLATLCREIGERVDSRFTVVLANGKVIVDTDEHPSLMDDHSQRPEVKQALLGEVGRSERFSHTIGRELMYVAVPIHGEQHGEAIGVVRVSRPLISVDQALGATRSKMLLGSLAAAALGLGASLLVSRRISLPIEQLKRGAERFAAGDLRHKVPAPQSQEMAVLAAAMNRMAAQLDERIRTILCQRNELEAVVSSMVEGVIAVDCGERIISINTAAARLLGIAEKGNTNDAGGQRLPEKARGPAPAHEPEGVHGVSIHDVVRNTDLAEFISMALSQQEPVEGEIMLHDGAGMLLQAHGTALRDSDAKRIGAVVVLNDITRLRRLETVRRDFVANVSHELRTPITSIKGFVETLIDGAKDKPEEAARFLDIIARQADRLNAIIGDLLSLARFEQESGEHQIAVETAKVSDILAGAVQLCQTKADARNMALRLDCPADLYAQVNAALIEQALVNLIDNAVKYSTPGSQVVIGAAAVDNEIVISVTDQGCGIPNKHLERLFERFYRVDKARSREMGGTGLGLSIVRHIALAHGGYPSVESTPGVGSTFSIHLPGAHRSGSTQA